MGRALAISSAFLQGYTGHTVELGLTYGGSGPKASARHAFDPARDDDAALVASVARGDARALEHIYECYSLFFHRWR